MQLTKIVGILSLVAVVFGLGTVAGICMDYAQAAPAEKPQLYELRTYTTHDGKLDDLHARFSDHTNRLFVKHGMTLIGYWTLASGDEKDNTLVYIIAHEDADAAKASWRAFGSDEEWKKAAADSQRDGPMLTNVKSQYLIPTDYSPLR